MDAITYLHHQSLSNLAFDKNLDFTLGSVVLHAGTELAQSSLALETLSVVVSDTVVAAAAEETAAADKLEAGQG